MNACRVAQGPAWGQITLICMLLLYEQFRAMPDVPSNGRFCEPPDQLCCLNGKFIPFCDQLGSNRSLFGLALLPCHKECARGLKTPFRGLIAKASCGSI